LRRLRVSQGYLMAATVLGAGLGHYVYNQDMDPLYVALLFILFQRTE
jgi:hypothetical protein